MKLYLNHHFHTNPVLIQTNSSFAIIPQDKSPFTMKYNAIAIGKLALLSVLTAQLSGLTLAIPLESAASPIDSPFFDKRAVGPVVLKTAAKFGVLAATTITNTGLTAITGNIGVSPGTAITGFRPPGTVSGTIYSGGTVASTAQTDAQNAYNTAIGLTPKTALPYSELGGKTLGPGTYTFNAAGVSLTGVLTLDGRSNPKAQFVIITGSTLITAASSKVVLINGAQACNVVYAVGSSATLGASSTIVGAVLAVTAITLDSGVSASPANLVALGAAVTLIDDTVKIPTGTCTHG